MLADYPIHATLPATDRERARRFYAEQLGLTPESDTPTGMFYRCGQDTQFVVYPSGGTANGAHTQLSWAVDDIAATVADLKARGVVFEEYDMPGLQTHQSVATMGAAQVAWFKDSEGNLLGLIQFN